MRRELLGRLLLTSGVVVLVVGLAAIGASRELRDSTSIGGAAADLLEVPSVRSGMRAELGRSLEEAYRPVVLPAEVTDVATDRMLENGYVVDEFREALEAAHRGWLQGGAMVVHLDPRVITEAAIGGVRDADVALANAFPPDVLLDVRPVAMPVEHPADSVADWGRWGMLLALAALVVLAAGAVIESRRNHTARVLARAVSAAGILLAVAALVLPLPALRATNDLVAVLGALTAQSRIPLMLIAALLVFAGLWLHAVADRLVASVERRIGAARRTAPPPPVRSGPRRTGRKSVRHRSEAIDAFFNQPSDDAGGSDQERKGVVIDARDPEHAEVVIGERSDEPDDAPDAPAPAPAAATPDEERAAALATERREALERIDGTRSRYRTHLPR